MEAHRVQQRCNELEKEETDAWMVARSNKIEAAINKLLHKQETELQALQKKIKTGFDEQMKDRKVQENRIKQKFANASKELKMQHDKEIICHKGFFKSKGGQATSPTMSKSKTFK